MSIMRAFPPETYFWLTHPLRRWFLFTQAFHREKWYDAGAAVGHITIHHAKTAGEPPDRPYFFTLDDDGKRVSMRSDYQNESDYWSDFAEKFDVSMAFIRQYLEAGQILRENKNFFKSIDFMKKGNIAKVLAFKKIRPLIESGQVDESTAKDILRTGKVKDIDALAEQFAQPRLETIKAETNVHVEGNVVRVDDMPVLSFSDDTPPDVKNLIASTVKEEARRKAANLEMIQLEVFPEEKAEFERNIGQLREIKDKGHRAYIIEVPVEQDDPGLYQALARALDPFVDRVIKDYWKKR